MSTSKSSSSRPGKPRLPIDAAGTSILQASQILAYITLFRPSVLILDEPDSHLHPNNQRALCNLILELATEHGFRPLISTHSRHVLDAMRERSTVLWVSNGSKVDFNSVTTASLLMEIGALDSVDYFAGGSIRCLFATEDSAAESIKALHSLLSVNGFKLPETDIRAYSGCTKIDSAKVLRGFLADKASQVQFVLHRDRDYMADEAAQKFET
jgi:energy-coupling factor transporter ATP-binding protein EcfA2